MALRKLKKQSCSQAQLCQATCLAAAKFLSISCGPILCPQVVVPKMGKTGVIILYLFYPSLALTLNRREWKRLKGCIFCLLWSAQYQQEEWRQENTTLQSLPFPPGNHCCLVSFHFLLAILSTSTVVQIISDTNKRCLNEG